MHRMVHASVLASIALSFTAVAVAETTPANAIKYRQFAMSAMAGHTGAISLLGFGRVEHEGHLKAHAQALVDLTEQMRVLFPANSATGETEALPLIWEEPENFAKAVAASETAVAELNAAVEANDRAGIAKGFRAVGESCKGCHDRYRKDQN